MASMTTFYDKECDYGQLMYDWAASYTPREHWEMRQEEFNKPKPTLDPSPFSEPNTPVYSSICKVEKAARLTASYVIYYETIQMITKNGDTRAGAILFELVVRDDITGEMTDYELWLPKKLLSNLIEADKTVCMFDKIFDKKIEELKEEGYTLVTKPIYYKDSIYG